MKLSTKAQYGLKACFYLAENKGQRPLSVERIAEIAGISGAYLEQLMIPLKKAGVVVSVRGANGGYALSKDPKEQSVGEIVRVLEDNLELVDCISGGCKNMGECPTCELWYQLSERINGFLDGVTLYDLQTDFKKKRQGDA